MARDFQQVGVIGLGTMGAGIAEVFARTGLSVVAVEVDESAVAAGRGHLENSTGRAVARGKLSDAEQRALLDRVTYSTDLNALADVDLVVEAVPEQLELKRQIFSQLDKICKPDAILATNTSSLSVTEIAVATGRPGKVVGLHFFNPAPVMPLVEVVPTLLTEEWATSRAEEFAGGVLGKRVIRAQDRPGFVVNALLVPYLLSAVRMLENATATRDDIDEGMVAGCGMAMGPLRLCDLIGLDTLVLVAESLYAEHLDPAYAPPSLLRRYVDAGWLGRKSGRGFYDYETSQS
jgi:3-hydroxybutyryl-CoA dehydrogenase